LVYTQLARAYLKANLKFGINQTNDVDIDTTALDEPVPISNLTALDTCKPETLKL